MDEGEGKAVSEPQLEEQPSAESEPDSKRIKLEAPPAASLSHTGTAASTFSSPPVAASLSSPTPPASTTVHDVEAALHGIDEAERGLVHNTVAGELLEHEQLKQSSPPLDDRERPSEASLIGTEPPTDAPLQSSPLISSSLAASPPPLQPLAPPLPPPLGKYQCDNCAALLTYSSLTEIYHCPLCYHTFTLYPPLAPTTSPPLLPLDSPTPPLVHQRLTQWTSADLYLYLYNVPGLSSIAAKSAAAGMDGRYFLSMHVSDMVEEFGLWGSGGAGGSVEGNAALVVQLLNAQRLLRGESVHSVADEKEVVALLVGMQLLSTTASKAQQPPKSAKKNKERVDKPRKEQRDSAQPADDGADADSAASIAEAVPARPVKRKQYRIPTAPSQPDWPAGAATLPAGAAIEATVLPLSHAQPTLQQAATVTSDGATIPIAQQQPMPIVSNGSTADAVMAQVAAEESTDAAAGAQSMATTADGSTLSVAVVSTVAEV